jgi:hypothetical protein
MTKKNLARDGSPKKLQPVTVNGGSYHMRNGQLIAGISRTQAAHPLDDTPLVTSPSVGKRLAPVAITPGMCSRTAPNDARLAPRSPRK